MQLLCFLFIAKIHLVDNDFICLVTAPNVLLFLLNVLIKYKNLTDHTDYERLLGYKKLQESAVYGSPAARHHSGKDCLIIVIDKIQCLYRKPLV